MGSDACEVQTKPSERDGQCRDVKSSTRVGRRMLREVEQILASQRRMGPDEETTRPEKVGVGWYPEVGGPVDERETTVYLW